MPVKLTAYVVDGHTVNIRPAPVERNWMEETGERFAYRCLPLNIANAYGWEILCSSGFGAEWSGAPGFDAVTVRPDPGTTAPAISHFGSGVLTFHVPCLFRTDPGYDLMVQAPMNRPRDAIVGLTGVVETDWSPYTFTMNWIFTTAGTSVRFEKDEPFCHIFPVRRGELDAVEPEMRVLSDNPELKGEHDRWTASRGQFIGDLKRPGSEAEAERWQKLYYRGLGPSGARASPEDHRTRLRLKPFLKLDQAADSDEPLRESTKPFD
jgi:hypothetical protein